MKNILILFASLLALSSQAATSVVGPTYPLPADAAVLLSSGRAGAVAKANLGHNAVLAHPQLLKAVYDFSVSGGAVGTILLKDVGGHEATLPAKAIVRRVLIDTVTPVTSGGSATIAFGVVSSADLKGSVNYASAPPVAYNATGQADGIPVGTAATAIKLGSSQKAVAMTVGTAALTAGKIELFIEYVLGD